MALGCRPYGYGSESTQGPSGITATDSSKCAERLWSIVTAVQPSSSTRTSGRPTFTIGSMAQAHPGHQALAPSRRAVVGNLRLLVEAGSDAMADELRTTEYPWLSAWPAPRGRYPDPASRPAHRDARLQAFLGHLEQPIGLLAHPAHAHRAGRVP
jgi:hypothetical protein